MSDLEEKTKPILEPMMLGEQETVVLSPRDQVVLARWAFKTALVLDLALPGNPCVPEQFFKDFYATKKPPTQGGVVWTTAYGGPTHAGYGTRRAIEVEGLDILLSPIRPPRRPFERTKTNGFVSTFAAFRAVFQVLGYIGRDWKPTDGGIKSQRVVIRIWPPTGQTVAWPRNKLALSDATLASFARREDFVS